MDIFYLNSNDEKVVLNKPPYRMLSETTVFDNEWAYTTKGINNLSIKKFKKNMVSKEFSLRIKGETLTDYYKNIDYINELFEKDIVNVKSGKLYFGNYYLDCYIISSEKEERYIAKPDNCITFKIISETGNWTKKTLFNFSSTNNDSYSTTGFDYPYDYMIDYQNSLITSQIINTGYAPADFEFIIYGPCINPAFSIEENTYSFEIELEENEYLKVIRTESEKTITKYKQNGETENAFYTRSTDFNVFETIPVGELNVAWEGDFDFDINILERRSEPKWT